MARLKYLDDWVRAVLNTPRHSLDILFQSENVIQDSIKALPFFTLHRAGFRRVSHDLLVALHAHIHGASCEEAIWETLLIYTRHAIPDEVASDLIDRDVAVLAMSHTRQSDAVMWRLQPLVDEVILTLAEEVYAWPTKSLSDLEQILERFSDDEWMLEHLAGTHPCSPEKRAALEKALANHPNRDKYLSIVPSHHCWTREENDAFWEVPRPLDAQGVAYLFGSRDSGELLYLAHDPETPLEVLEDLSTVQGIENAKAIRHAARINLRENHGEVEL